MCVGVVRSEVEMDEIEVWKGNGAVGVSVVTCGGSGLWEQRIP